MASIAALFRYPVKSMLGERVDAALLTDSGITGDRAWAVVDRSDGTVASAKHPRKWARLLEVSASYADEPTPESPVPAVVLRLPDGSEVSSDGGDADTALTALLGRDVTLACEPPDGATFEEVWPDIDGLAPGDFIASTTTAREDSGEPVSAIGLSQMAPPGRFFDLAPLHLLTTATLDELRRLEPEADFDVRRYRPNVLVDTDGESGFVESGWTPGTKVRLGDVTASVLLGTMRCVMTTLAQGGDRPIPADRSTLKGIARHNRIDLGIGTWACAGVYAGVSAPGTARVGDAVAVAAPG